MKPPRPKFVDPRKIPRWLRPKLRADQVSSLKSLHWGNLDAIHRGVADLRTLREFVAGSLTWGRIAELLPDSPENKEARQAMQDQIDVGSALLVRWHETRRIRFEGPEYEEARQACLWMDAMAETVDLHTANEAADWSERKLAEMLGEQDD